MSRDKKLPRLALALGDPAGIGPEICIKAALDSRVRAICEPLLVGDPLVLEEQAARAGLSASFEVFQNAADFKGMKGSVIPVLGRRQFANGELKIGQINADNGRSSLDSARAAIEAASAGLVDAVVAAPQTQTAIAQAGIAFDGYPTFVAGVLGLPRDDVFLMLCFDDKRIVHVTLHHSVRRAIDLVTFERVLHCIRCAHEALHALGITKPRIAVSGLNPHAGESGLFGEEDAEFIRPAVETAQSAGIAVSGPFGADLLLHEKADAHIVMLHDQGHIPAKLLAKHKTAGHTIGAKIRFSSVAHGSALDIAGQNKADPTAIVEAARTLFIGL